ncbi:MAG: cation transporter, partial [Treponema sp.]|nr:cation transporter [Treponema sp.]
MKNNTKEIQRDKKIVTVSIVSIAANVVLASFKATAGIFSGSISIILDAVNNLSDALSSIITIIGTKLSLKPADKKHPFGYGRIEYLSASIIAAIVLYAGFTSLKESILKIIHPQKAEYSTVTITIVATAVLVKFILGAWVKKQGKVTDSKSLVASGEDARNDAFLSAGVLAGALIAKFTGFSLEAYIGCVISLFILKSGIEMLKDTLDDILGSRISKELSRNVKKNIAAFPNVLGAYDLSLNSYGPDRMIGSVHIEVPEDMTAKEIDDLSIKITNAIYKE